LSRERKHEESNVSQNELTLSDLVDFAESRGGEFLSMDYRGLEYKYSWRCGREHEFEGSVHLIVHAGYWCPKCFPDVDDPTSWDYDEHAAIDPLLRRFHRS